MCANRAIIVGTRGSQLAMRQTSWLIESLKKEHPEQEFVVTTIATTGDRVTDWSTVRNDQGIFVREIEEGLMEGRFDLAVHSIKDLPTDIPSDLVIAAVPMRADPRDALVSRDGRQFHQLPEGASIGTSSLRRHAQLLRARPDLAVEEVRGNVDTRMRKLEAGKVDALLIAAAGLERLGWKHRITQYMDLKDFLPAPGQGALGIECRRKDTWLYQIVEKLTHSDSMACVIAERAFLKATGGGCRVPIAALATVTDAMLTLQGMIINLNGTISLYAEETGPMAQACAIGQSVAQKLMSQGGQEILDQIRNLEKIK